MKIENVLCPGCGIPILATIPLGQSIVCVSLLVLEGNLRKKRSKTKKATVKFS